jgi:single-strand DNA-binding protein
MARSANKAILIGFLGKDPELKYTAGGQPHLHFSLATSKSFKKGDEWQDKTTWHNIVVWGKAAEYTRSKIAKGSHVYVEGEIENRSYEADGVKRYVSEVVAWTVVPLEKKAKDEGADSDPGAYVPPAGGNDDSIPF